MGLTGRDIICISTHYWDDRRFRKQEFMSRFAQANRVLFVEPSFSMARSPEMHLRSVATNRYLLSRSDSPAEGMHVLTLPRGLPGWSHPRIERLNYRWYGRIVGRAAKRLGFQDAILWIYRPSYLHSLQEIPHRQLVFDLVDDLSAYGGSHSKHVELAVQRLVENSDLLVVTSKTLLDRYGPLARHAVQISNGYDAQVFSPEVVGEAVPISLTRVKRPILGFVGTLFTFLDFDLLGQVARIHHDKSLVLVGPVETNVERDFSLLCKQPNVVHVPAQHQTHIPSHIAAFDVCLNPFRSGRVAANASPLKIYEYLAMGRPVVSTPMDALQLEDIARVIAFADGSTNFSEQIDRCLTRDIQEGTATRRRAVAAYSWDNLFERLDNICARVLNS